MSDWGGTSDQYFVDTTSRYPLFSDVQTDDYSLTVPSHKYAQKMKGINHNTRYDNSYNNHSNAEVGFQREQMGIPSYYRCNCSQCVRELSHLKRLENARGPRSGPVPQSWLENSLGLLKSPEYFTNGTGLENLSMDGGTVVIIFLFLVIVFICCFYGRALNELRDQIKSLKYLVKGRTS